MKIIETGPREIRFVLWGHCQNLLDDPRTNDTYMHTLANSADPDEMPHNAAFHQD